MYWAYVHTTIFLHNSDLFFFCSDWILTVGIHNRKWLISVFNDDSHLTWNTLLSLIKFFFWSVVSNTTWDGFFFPKWQIFLCICHPSLLCCWQWTSISVLNVSVLRKSCIEPSAVWMYSFKSHWQHVSDMQQMEERVWMRSCLKESYFGVHTVMENCHINEIWQFGMTIIWKNAH